MQNKWVYGWCWQGLHWFFFTPKSMKSSIRLKNTKGIVRTAKSHVPRAICLCLCEVTHIKQRVMSLQALLPPVLRQQRKKDLKKKDLASLSGSESKKISLSLWYKIERERVQTQTCLNTLSLCEAYHTEGPQWKNTYVRTGLDRVLHSKLKKEWKLVWLLLYYSLLH